MRAPSRGTLFWKIFASIPVQRRAVETLATVSITDNAVQQKKEAKLAVVADPIFCLAAHASHRETYWFGMDANINWYLGGISVNDYAYEKNLSIHLCSRKKKPSHGRFYFLP